MPLPHVAGQSASRFDGDVLQPGGQHPSIVVPLHGSCVVEQRALQVVGDPVNVCTCQHWPGVHMVGQDEGGSHVSPALVSTTPSPQPAQSESFWAVHPAGQHRSLPAFEQVLAACWQTRLHVAALPVWVSVVQSFWSSQVGHEPGGSHVSPASIRPLPHPAQSASFIAVQLTGQQPSPAMHVVTFPELTHSRWHMVPCSARTVQAMFGHDVGQLVPSQSSPASSTPLPHTGGQLLSFTALHALGQQLSLFVHAVCVPAVWHWA
jgi:hypothetical protein